MQPTKALNPTALSLILSSVGGFVDGVGFLMLFGLFISHMSGNSTRLGLFAAEGDWTHVLLRLFAIMIFVAGAFAAAFAAALLSERKRGSVSLLLAAESALLALFGLLAAPLMDGVQINADSHLLYYFLVSLPAFAMGLQNATLRQTGGPAVRTTFVSGVLTTLGEELAGAVHWAWRQSTAQKRSFVGLLAQAPSAAKAVQAAGIWTCYVTGAITGAWLLAQVGVGVVAIPVVALASLAAALRRTAPKARPA